MFSFTFLLYLSIFLSTTYFALKTQKITRKGVKYDARWLILAFLIHWVFCSFTKIGTDHEQYIYIISSDASYRFAMGQEIGFNGLSMLLFSLTHNAEICIFIIKTISMLLVYWGFFLLRKDARLSLCMFGYNVTTYLIAYYLLAMHLAVALVFVSGAMMIRNYRPYIAILLVVAGMTVHASCILMVICFLGILFLNKIKIKTGKTLFVILMIATLFVLSNVFAMIGYALSNMEMLTAYEQYTEAREREGTGLFNYFLYSIFLLYVLSVLKSNLNSYARNSIIMFFLSSLVFAILGYSLGISRLNYYSIVFIVVAIPYYFYQVQVKDLKVVPVLSNKTLLIMWWVYLGFRMIVTLKNYSSDIWSLNNYEMFNPFNM